MSKKEEIKKGAVIDKPGNSKVTKTGGWRSFRPVILQEKCIKCYNCWKYCPDNSIKINNKGEVYVDYDYCKGCLICFNECPADAIKKEVEKK